MRKAALIAPLILLGCLPVARIEQVHAQRCEDLLDENAVRGGLAVVIGCGEPLLLSNLRTTGPLLVHGLEADPGRVAAAREHLRQQGLYGPVTVSHREGPELPYIDNFANLIVVTADAGEVTAAEIDRVLAPRGTVVDLRSEKVKTTHKPWPEAIDEWPHYLYDATNNAVSADTVVAPPRGLQWTCGPEYARSHEHFGSVSAMVSSAGRVFYIIDEGPISSVFLPPDWKLAARDAFNGVLLWQRPITNWESPLRGFRSGPPEIGRRLIADDSRVYAALGYGEPVTVLDAASGKGGRALAATEGARELLLADGVLYVLADDMTAADHNARKQWINSTAPTLSGYVFPKRAIAMYGRQRIVALDSQTGKLRWRRQFDVSGEIMPTTMAVAGDRVCLQTTSHLVCLDTADGEDVWRSERPVARSRFSWSTPTLVVHDGVVLTVDRVATDNADASPPGQGSRWILDNAHQTTRQGAELVATALADGKEIWRVACFENYDTPLDIFVIDDVVWVGDLRHKRNVGFTQGLDLRTGKVATEIPDNAELYGLQMGHHRCHRNKATVRYLLLGRDGIEMIDPKRGTGEGNWWVRGTCQYGVMPANGLIYVPQHSCACHPQELLIGFNTLAPRSAAGEKSAEAPRPLMKGPGFAERSAAKSEIATSDWPTYRRDAGRSGFQGLAAPRSAKLAWNKPLNAPITAPVVAGGRVFVAETDQHMLHALSAEYGQTAWTFSADGRIDSPPSLCGGLCVFGTRGGTVYCLRADDGELVWRFRAGPRRQMHFAYEQLESVWPVHGSVLIDDDAANAAPTVYFAAGRSSHVDGGIHVYALELPTGKLLHHANLSMTAGREVAEGVVPQRALPDVLSLQHGSVFMRNVRFNKQLAPQPQDVAHLYAQRGWLDDTWWHRTYWLYGTHMMSAYGGWPNVGNAVPAGRLLVFDGSERIYGYGRMAYRAGAGHVHPDAAKDYKLFAETLAPKPKATPPGAERPRRKPAGRREIVWSKPLPFVARAIVLSQDALLVAGSDALPGAAGRHGPGHLLIASRADGEPLAQCNLPGPVILDGMALTADGVFVCGVDGSVVCLRSGQ